MGRLGLLAALALLLATAEGQGGEFLYLACAGDRQIVVFERRADGALKLLPDRAEFAGEPGNLASDPQRKFLFAALRSTGRLTSHRLDARTGKLTQISDIKADADPAYLAVDKSGKYLLSAYYVAGKVAVHAIGTDGSLSEERARWTPTATKAHAIETDATNRFALVPHTSPNAVFQFRFDAQTGKLTPNDPAQISTGPNTGPRHLAFHPKQKWVYIDNEQGSSVTAYAFDANRGTIEPMQTLSTLPEGFSGGNSCAHIEITPNGRFFYVSNRGHDSLAGYRVDAETGRMTSLGQFATEKTPRSFTIAPDGRHLYAAGESSNTLAIYAINPETGELKQRETIPVGKRPWCVLAVSTSD
ncbi:MAG TPA: lactonase family protein [Planctomycetaceae bacterium]|nr:lactonase family protein [Planctomycetaceae bacterium]